MTRSDKSKVGRNIAKTRAGVFGVATGEKNKVYSTKSGAYKSGSNRFEPSKSSSSVRDNIRTHKKKTGCFLTTAACEFQALPDNCKELTILREFRDVYLSQRKGGTSLVQHYYQVAPLIAERLRFPNDHMRIWSDVQRCVKLIELSEHEAALQCYTELVSDLQAQLIEA